MAFQISITDSDSDIHRHYHEGIDLSGEYEIGLKSLVICHNVPNITKSNNRLTLIPPNSTSEVEFQIPTGSYTLEDIQNTIQSIEPESNWISTLDDNTFKVKLYSSWDIDFREGNSLASLLGFKNQILKAEKVHQSERMPELYSINMIKVKCNLIKSNFQDLTGNDNTIFEFPLSYTKGSKIVERPINISYYRIFTETIHDLSLRIVDQYNRLIDFHNNKICVTLDFRPKRWRIEY